MNKLTVPVLAILCLSISCGNNKDTQKLIWQVEHLKKAVLASDKKAVCGFFDFPVRDTQFLGLQNYTANSPTPSDGIETDPKMDSADFVKSYRQIFTPEVVNIFRHFHIADLKVDKEEIATYTPKDTSKKCTFTYSIQITSNGELHFSYNTNNRTDIQMSDDDQFNCHEFSEGWTFKMVNGKLKFVTVSLAG